MALLHVAGNQITSIIGYYLTQIHENSPNWVHAAPLRRLFICWQNWGVGGLYGKGYTGLYFKLVNFPKA